MRGVGVLSFAILCAVFSMSLRGSESQTEPDSLNAEVCTAAAAEIGKLATSRATPIAVSFRDAPEFVPLPPNVDDKTKADHEKMIESETKRAIARQV